MSDIISIRDTDLSPRIIYLQPYLFHRRNDGKRFPGCEFMKRKAKTVCDEIIIASYNNRNRTVSDERLTQIFSRVGMKYGYEDVEAVFSAFSDFKVKWTRTYKWIRFQVSDYLDRAPEQVLEDLATTLFERISGREQGYSEAFIRYLNDPELRKTNSKDFIGRKRGLKDTTIGKYHDLNDCVNRLRDQGLIPDDLECILCWQSSTANKASGCSTTQGVAWVNDRLDQKGVPENVLDYAVYTMLAHLMVGFKGDEKLFMRLDALYPMRAEAIAWLDRNGLYI